MAIVRVHVFTCRLFFVLLLLPYLVFSRTPNISFEIFPSNTEIQREGDTVSLLCRAVNLFDTDVHNLGWVIPSPSGTPEHILTRDNTMSGHYRARFVREDCSTYVLNLTIDSVDQRDNRTFSCRLIEYKSDGRTVVQRQIDLHLSVFPVDAFPICSPAGQSAVSVGSELSCRTLNTAVPSIAGDDWTLSKKLLFKTASVSDNATTYVCTAEIPNSFLTLSCNIGPLTVLPPGISTMPPDGLPTTALNNATKKPVALGDPDPGLTRAGAVVIAVFVTFLVNNLLILLVVHIFCYRCNPRRWLAPVSFARDFLNSYGTSDQQSRGADGRGSGPETANLNSPTEQQPGNYAEPETVILSTRQRSNSYTDPETGNLPNGQRPASYIELTADPRHYETHIRN